MAYFVDILAHSIQDTWSHWMEWLFSISKENEDGSVTIPARAVKRWRRQIEASYDELPRGETKSDREIAHRYLSLLLKFLGLRVIDAEWQDADTEKH